MLACFQTRPLLFFAGYSVFLPELQSIDCTNGGTSTTPEFSLPGVNDANEFLQLISGEVSLSTPRKYKESPSSIARRLARNSGQEYITEKGKYVPAKVFKHELCNCRFDCKTISAEERKLIFDKFWGTKCWLSQENFIAASVRVSFPKRIVQDSRRQHSRTFLLNNKRVCKTVFLSTLGISNQRLHYCVTKKANRNGCSPDKRRRFTREKNPDNKYMEVETFLDSSGNEASLHHTDVGSSTTACPSIDSLSDTPHSCLESTTGGTSINISTDKLKTADGRDNEASLHRADVESSTTACPSIDSLSDTTHSCLESITGGTSINISTDNLKTDVGRGNEASLHHTDVGSSTTACPLIDCFAHTPHSCLESTTSEFDLSINDGNEFFQLISGEVSLPTPRKYKESPSSIARRLARNSGQEYITEKGKYVPAKVFKHELCNCRFDCKNISAEERKLIFDKFWGTKCWLSQENFIAASVKISFPKRHFVQDSRRQHSRTFLLNNKRVCKTVFLSTLGISNQRLHYCVTKKVNQNLCSPDKRGRFTREKNPDDKCLEVETFLDSIPKYNCHFIEDDKLFFMEEVTKTILFNEYKKKQIEKGSVGVTKSFFCKLFNQYNVGIYAPKTDSCQFCDAVTAKMKQCKAEEKLEIEENLDLHLQLAKKATDSLNEATNEAKMSSSLLVFTFDVQKNLLLPRLQPSVVLQKQQLCMFRVGFNNIKNSEGYMAMWPETEGKGGSNEICSSILSFLDSIATSTVRRVKTFSDEIGRQIGNMSIICFFMWVCDTRGFDTWEHTFMETGHSNLPSERDFSIIERKARGRELYSKEDWISFTKKSMAKRCFQVVDMSDKFLDIDSLVSYENYSNDETTGEMDINFMQLKSFTICRNSSIVSYRTSTGGPYQFECRLMKCEPHGPQSCNTKDPISKEKFTDLQSLLPYIPPVYHEFYNNLPHM